MLAAGSGERERTDASLESPNREAGPVGIVVRRKAPSGLAAADADEQLASKEEATYEEQMEEAESLPSYHTFGQLEWGNRCSLHCVAWSSAVLRT